MTITCTGTVTELQSDRMSISLPETEQLRTGGHVKLQLKAGQAEQFTKDGPAEVTITPGS